ncbi:MAG TPA: hypothetical protein VLN49_10375 [Gemmatimonadaceae bacterium]|nr:hypothetical protein [Gemmatimonadaceae bacterium]
MHRSFARRATLRKCGSAERERFRQALRVLARRGGVVQAVQFSTTPGSNHEPMSQ